MLGYGEKRANCFEDTADRNLYKLDIFLLGAPIFISVSVVMFKVSADYGLIFPRNIKDENIDKIASIHI